MRSYKEMKFIGFAEHPRCVGCSDIWYNLTGNKMDHAP